MFFLKNPNKKNLQLPIIHFILLLLVSFLVISATPVFAHSLKIDGAVGGTLHIEPNDTARAGKPAQTWFALTRKGGKVIPLEECNCQLAVYAEPHTPGKPALLEPNLQPVQAERYQGIPGTEITFPQPGRYQLKLKGEPKTAGNFQPFELKFQVTVAAGKAVQTPKLIQTPALDSSTSTTGSTTTGSIQPIPIILIVLAAAGIIFFVVKGLKKP